MPELKDYIAKKTDDGYRLSDAIEWLKGEYNHRFDRQELDTSQLANELDNALYDAALVLAQVKLRLGDEGWARWSASLGEPGTSVVNFLTETANAHHLAIALPEKLPQRFEGTDARGKKVFVEPHELAALNAADADE
jgi:hypothetical protein